jgi:hypothetical protein
MIVLKKTKWTCLKNVLIHTDITKGVKYSIYLFDLKVGLGIRDLLPAAYQGPSEWQL